MLKRMQMILLLFLLVACPLDECNQAGPTGPELPNKVTTSVPVEPPKPPRVDQPFSVESYRGVLAFGLGHPGQTEADVLTFVNSVRAKGWNTVQPCSETEFWDGSFQYPIKPRDPERLRWLLDILARVPGIQVALVGNCTLKRQVPLAEQAEWARQVAGVAADYQNVAIFTHNEFDNCRGRSDWGGNAAYCAGKQDVAEHVQLYRSYGIQVVTADDSFAHPADAPPGVDPYVFRLGNVGAWPASFHPDRTRNGSPWDPSLNQLNELGRRHGTYLLSETVAFADYSGNCSGLRTCDTERIQAYVDRCAAANGCRFTFHCEHCLNGLVPTWIPEAR